MGPSLGCCTLAYSYYLGALHNFADLLPVVATYIVGLAFVAGALASDTDPFDVFAASFASKLRQNRRHQMMVRGMSERNNRRIETNIIKREVN